MPKMAMSYCASRPSTMQNTRKRKKTAHASYALKIMDQFVVKSDAQALFSMAPFNGKSYVRTIPELQGRIIYASQFGWLILRDENPDPPDCCSITLFNPLTSKSINLPPLMYHEVAVRPTIYLLTSPPSDNNNDNEADSNCFVLVCFPDQAFVCRCQSTGDCGRDSNCWYSQRIEIGGESLRLHRAVVLNGVIYGWASDSNRRQEYLISLEVVDHDASNPFTLTALSLVVPETPFSGLLSVGCPFMVESCGSIYLISVGTRNFDGAHAAKIWEFDLQKGIWFEVKCLGDRSFFLSFHSCTWCWASTTDHSEVSQGAEGNCLYIFDFELAYGGVVKYSLKDCSSTLLPCGNLLNGPWSFTLGYWVMPQICCFEAGKERRKLIDNQDNDVSESFLTVGTTDCKQLLQQNEPQEGRLSELPQDLIELLSRYMHLFDCWNFRCTSKLIQSATPLPLWRTNTLFPLLLVFEDEGALCRLMEPCRDDSWSCVFGFSQDYFDIVFSKDGWLLVCDCKTLEFFNPFTRERRDLPFPSSWCTSDPIGFSTSPVCTNCLTVGFAYSSVDLSEIIIEYIKLGDTKWSSCHFDNSQDPQFRICNCSPIYHAGAFYWLDMSGYLGVFEIVNGNPSWRVYDIPFEVNLALFHSCYLVECGKKIILVIVEGMSTGESVYVFRFKQSKKRWSYVLSLGNYTLFIRPNSSTSVATSDTKMKNRIYFPLIEGNHIVYYSLETKKYYVDGNEASSNNLFFKKIPSRCCWI